MSKRIRTKPVKSEPNLPSKNLQSSSSSNEEKIISTSEIVQVPSQIPSMSNNIFSRLGREFFNQPCVDLAKALLGKILVRKMTSPNTSTSILMTARIVETESYLGGEDRGSCSYNNRKTDFNEPMFMAPGTCFVYMTYGMYHCFNISSRGEGAAVLLRALEPVSGLEYLQENRQQLQKAKKRKLDSLDVEQQQVSTKTFKLTELCSGPSKLCMAMCITKQVFNRADLTVSDEMYVVDDGYGTVNDMDIVQCARIGINRAGEWNTKPLRFYIRSSDYISVKAKD